MVINVMTILKTFKFYGYYVTTLRYHNTGRKVPRHIDKWEYSFTVSERVNNKSKTILTLDVPANKLSGAKRGLRSAMVVRKLLKKKGTTYIKIKPKETIKKFILKNTLFFYEWQTVKAVRNKLQKEGFSYDEAWAWQEAIERGQISNQQFKAHGYIWETKSGVMGARGLRMGSESPRHVKIRIVKKLEKVKKVTSNLQIVKNISKKYSNKTKTFEKEWWKSDTGYCPVAAYNLSKHLNTIGYESSVIYGGYRWMDDHYWINVKINGKEFWIDPTYYQFRHNKDLGGGVLIGSPEKFISTGYKKVYICKPEGMTKFRKDLFHAYSGGKNNPKYRV